MSSEMILLKDLAVITATRQEWLDIAASIRRYIATPDFSAGFDAVVETLLRCYSFTDTLLQPFVAIADAGRFAEQFDVLNGEYQQSYLNSLSEARHAADACFEHYLLLSQGKECKTGYPPLKHSFARLDYMVDKYVTNDAWLVMHIDSVIRRLSRFLNEVAELKKVDSDDALALYAGLINSVRVYQVLLRA
jgi:hypothetical protein